jgi:vacuolar-type H+-ATPase subunit H
MKNGNHRQNRVIERSDSVAELESQESRAYAVVEEAIRQRDRDVASARQKADLIIGRAKEKAAANREGVLASAREKVEAEKEKVLHAAKKEAEKIKAGRTAAMRNAADHAYSKVLKPFF